MAKEHPPKPPIQSKAVPSSATDATSNQQPAQPVQPTKASPPASSTNYSQWADKIFWATVFVGGGIILLLVNLGYLPSPDWSVLVKFWPAALILMGLHMLLDKWALGKVITTIVALLIVFGGIFYAMAVADPQFYQSARQALPILPYSEQLDPELEGQVNQQIIDQQADYDQAASRVVNIDMGTGRLEVKSSATQRQIELRSHGQASASATSSKVNQDNDRITVDIDINKNFTRLTQSHKQYILTLGQAQLPTQLNLDIGAGRAELDFTSHALALSGGTWQVGAGQLEAKLNQQSLPSDKLRAKVGVGRMTIELSSDIGLQVIHDVGLGSLEIYGQKVDRQGAYTSDNYDQAQHKLVIEAEIGVGQLVIKQP